MLSAIYVPVAQLDRVLDYESRGRGFESLLARQRKYLLNNVRQVFFLFGMAINIKFNVSEFGIMPDSFFSFRETLSFLINMK